MLELLRHNRPIESTTHARRSSGIPMLPNAAALPAAILPASGLPRESLPRIVNPTGVPLTPEERFTVRIV